LRTAKHQASIKKAVEAGAKKIVIIGASFIGTECAASLKMQFKDKVDLQLVNGEACPFSMILGKELGGFY
jgi:hypothetical protein